VTEQPEPADWPSRRSELHDRLAAAIRDAACPGNCGLDEADCTRRNIQPEVWHHGVLADVSGAPEMFARTALTVLYREWPWLQAEAEEAEQPGPAATEATETAICPHGCNVTHCPCPACEAERLDEHGNTDQAELAAEKARTQDLATSLYYAQDALDFVAERCDLADQQQRTVTTADVRQWLKGPRCARQIAAEQRERTTANNPPTTPAP